VVTGPWDLAPLAREASIWGWEGMGFWGSFSENLSDMGILGGEGFGWEEWGRGSG
jgi:hypothetical protein